LSTRGQNREQGKIKLKFSKTTSRNSITGTGVIGTLYGQLVFSTVSAVLWLSSSRWKPRRRRDPRFRPGGDAFATGEIKQNLKKTRKKKKRTDRDRTLYGARLLNRLHTVPLAGQRIQMEAKGDATSVVKVAPLPTCALLGLEPDHSSLQQMVLVPF
jgi:hypothetical protein